MRKTTDIRKNASTFKTTILIMRYFIDTEFLEGPQKTFFGKSKPTIDLISIGIVSEDRRSYYAISKEFNLKEAWNRWEQRTGEGDYNNINPRNYWIRDNVLKPIYIDLISEYNSELNKMRRMGIGYIVKKVFEFNYKSLKWLLKKYGRSRVDIANDICAFIYGDDCEGSGMSAIEMAMRYEISDKTKEPIFYGYYCDYDWVAFAFLFGKMINLPKGFPMYCIDLKQTLDEKYALVPNDPVYKSLGEKLKVVKQRSDYPKQTNEHNALSDAKWNFELYKFLQAI